MWGSEPSILVVDDDRGCRELHADWLSTEYTVQTAAGGREALATIDETVDLVLFEWALPVVGGEAFLTELLDQGYDGNAVAISGLDVGIDLSSLPIADYLVKPVDEATLLATVDRLRTRERLGELFSLSERKAQFETRQSTQELERSDEYRRLQSALTRQREAVQSLIRESRLDWADAFEVCVESFGGTDPGHEF